MTKKVDMDGLITSFEDAYTMYQNKGGYHGIQKTPVRIEGRESLFTALGDHNGLARTMPIEGTDSLSYILVKEITYGGQFVTDPENFVTLAKIHRNDTVEFVLDPCEMDRVVRLLTNGLQFRFPFFIRQFRNGVYKVAHTQEFCDAIHRYGKEPDIQYSYIHGHEKHIESRHIDGAFIMFHYMRHKLTKQFVKSGHDYCKGLTYNLRTGESPNPKDKVYIRDAERATQYNKDTKRLKSIISFRARLGTFTQYINSIQGVSAGHYSEGEWEAFGYWYGHPEVMQLLEAIIHGPNKAFIERFLLYVRASIYYDVLRGRHRYDAAITNIIRANSHRLRVEYGVLVEEEDHGTDNISSS